MKSKDIRQIIISSRPILWLPHYTAFLLGSISATYFDLISRETLIALFLFGFPYSYVIYATNDIFDRSTDILNDRKGGLWGAKNKGLSNSAHITLTIFVATFFVLGITLFSYEAGIVALVMIILAILYSAPPIRLKRIPIVDHLTGGALYAYSIALTAQLMAGDKFTDIDLISPYLLTLFGVGWVLHALGAILDEKPDRDGGETTSVTFFGSKVVLTYTSILLLLLIAISQTKIVTLLLGVNLIMTLFFYSKRVRESSFIRHHFPKIFIITAFLASLILAILHQFGISFVN